MNRPPSIVLCMHEALGFLNEAYRLPRLLACELIELIIYSQLETIKMNGIESVYGERSSYITVHETLDDFIDQKILMDPMPMSRTELRRAATMVMLLGELPYYDDYVERYISPDTLHCKIHWRSSDVLIHFV